MLDLVEKILSEQAPSGAFYTTVLHQGRRYQDENGLVTCLVLNELARLPRCQTIGNAIHKGLHFVESCASEENRTYHLYPGGHRPSWARETTPRTDETVLSALTLFRHRQLSYSDAMEVVREIRKCQLQVLPSAGFPWVKLGAYKTWIDSDLYPNRVDCVVNAHIAGFLKYLGAEDEPGYQAAVATVVEGIKTLAHTPGASFLLTPYHPDPNELTHAMERAVDMGVTEFTEVLDAARCRLKPMRRNSGITPVGGSENKKTLWFSPSLQLARNLAKYHALPAEPVMELVEMI